MSEKTTKTPATRPPRYQTWCALCDRDFTATQTSARFCSAPCKAEAHRIVGILQKGRPRTYRSLALRLDRAGGEDAMGQERGGPLATIAERLRRQAASG